jgi:site-specific DNA-adenine methylase
MSGDLEIVAKNGRRYKDFRAYHIAIGHAVRQALLDFYKDVKNYAITEIESFYASEFQGSEYYDNTYGMLNSLIESGKETQLFIYKLTGVS